MKIKIINDKKETIQSYECSLANDKFHYYQEGYGKNINDAIDNFLFYFNKDFKKCFGVDKNFTKKDLSIDK